MWIKRRVKTHNDGGPRSRRRPLYTLVTSAIGEQSTGHLFKINASFSLISYYKQTTENQRFEILQYTAERKLHIDRWIEETVSSTKSLSQRKLGSLSSSRFGCNYLNSGNKVLLFLPFEIELIGFLKIAGSVHVEGK